MTHRLPTEDNTNHQTSTALLKALLMLNSFMAGGLAALLLVNRLLNAQLTVYKTAHFASASAILDFMDDLLPYLVIAIGGFLLLTFATVSVWLWTKSQSRLPKYGIALLVLMFTAITLWIVVGRNSNVESLPMLITPTPVP